MRRRTFLGATAAAAALWKLRSARAQFGAFPSGSESVMLPDNVRAKRVLEVFLYGGLSPWETLYYVKGYGQPTDPQYANQQYYTFKTSSDQYAQTCGGAAMDRVFGADALGVNVELGPFAWRLWQRQDVVDRMRIIVQKHTLEPHEAAVPQALTGRPVGQPTAAGLGAHVQRARIEANDMGRTSPYSYVFATGGISSDNVAAAAAPGAHPGSARPLLIKTDNAAGFTQLLGRSTVGTGRSAHDALVQAYQEQYDGRLTWPDKGRVRSARTDDLEVAQRNTMNVDAIAALLKTDTGGDLFAKQSGASCGRTRTLDNPHTALDAAAHLLTHPTEPASYVCVSDTGLFEASGGGGYDTHTDNARDTAMNFDNMLQKLLSNIQNPADPPDPKKISLDDTMIILNTEFGRTPTAQDGGNGRNHHPYGYVTAFIGGPAQKGIAGAIGPDGNASMFGTPSENRIAALLAMGIWPFAQEAFAVSDVPSATGEVDAAMRAMQMFLGRTA